MESCSVVNGNTLKQAVTIFGSLIPALLAVADQPAVPVETVAFKRTGGWRRAGKV
jgi:hypothetical protein